jgi:hypothetical protein
MLGDASDFTPLDLLGSLGLNAAATHFACQDGTLRTGFKVLNKKSGVKEVIPLTDARFLGGLAAALAGQFGPPMARRVGHDVATGLLGSFVATETCRRAAEVKKQRIEMVPVQDSQQITESAPASAPPPRRGKAKADPVPRGGGNYARGSMNSAYGW